jgi:hypothetical protein
MISLDDFIKQHKLKNESFSDVFIALVNDEFDMSALQEASVNNGNANYTLKDTLLLEAIRFISRQKFGLELKKPPHATNEARKIVQANYQRNKIIIYLFFAHIGPL